MGKIEALIRQTSIIETMDFERRFSGIANLYGREALARFVQSHVMVIGTGGVGSWVVESLARSGVGHLTLIDMDHVTESNINRQLPALGSTLGKAKIEVLQARVQDINPACKVTLIDDFISAENTETLLAEFVGQNNALVVDCIDHAKTKASLIAWCKKRHANILTVGGAGGCIDPLKIQIKDLSRTQNDSLLSRTRKHLRQQHGFARNPKRSFCVPAVFSKETPAGEKAVSGPHSHKLNCAGFGSVVHVTASFGFVTAGQVLSMLSKQDRAN